MLHYWQGGQWLYQGKAYRAYKLKTLIYCCKGSESMIELLIENGADIHVRNKYQNIPLLQALAQGNHCYGKKRRILLEKKLWIFLLHSFQDFVEWQSSLFKKELMLTFKDLELVRTFEYKCFLFSLYRYDTFLCHLLDASNNTHWDYHVHSEWINAKIIYWIHWCFGGQNNNFLSIFSI